MSIFYMMCGISGSGKSTLAKVLRDCDSKSGIEIEIFSSDDLREELYGDVNDQLHNTEVFNELHKRIREALKEDKDVIYDATNLSAKRRKSFLKTLPAEVYKECIIVPCPYETILERMEKRERKVPVEVIRRQIANFQTPFYDEGWDKIEICKDYECEYIDLRKTLLANKDMKHDNPHHTLSIYNHMIKAAEKVFEVCDEEVVILAALYHDIGKFYTKAFVDYKGQPSEIAHFYGHEGWGAWLALCSTLFEDKDDSLLFSFLICHHMDAFLEEKNKINLKEKYKDLSPKIISWLTYLHEADLAAH